MKEYILTSDGKILRRTIDERELDLSQQLTSALIKDVSFKIPSVFDVPDTGRVSCCITNDSSYFTTNLSRLIIRCPWHLTTDNILIPDFHSTTDPIITVTWTPPDTMLLKFVTRLVSYQLNTSMPKRWCLSGCWLYAVHTGDLKSFYRLPIANVHDDCSCCTGLDSLIMNTQHEVVLAALTNFDTARYNSDLWRNPELTHDMFRVKPDVGASFKTLVPIPVDWRTLCVKVGTTITNYTL